MTIKVTTSQPDFPITIRSSTICTLTKCQVSIKQLWLCLKVMVGKTISFLIQQINTIKKYETALSFPIEALVLLSSNLPNLNTSIICYKLEGIHSCRAYCQLYKTRSQFGYLPFKMKISVKLWKSTKMNRVKLILWYSNLYNKRANLFLKRKEYN